jgi:preprotein translocase subunit SecA
MVTSFLNRSMTKIFGSRNDRLIKTYRKRVEQINALEPEMRKLTDAQMKERTAQLRQRLENDESELAVLPEAFALMRESMDRQIGLRSALNPETKFDPSALSAEGQAHYAAVKSRCVGEHDWRFVDVPLELYDAIRDAVPADRPPFRARPFDVQLIGGMVLFEGKIAEMATGEGKTFVAPLACFLMSLTGKHCHVVTVNDYLVKRDSSWVAPAFYALGMSVGYIQAFMDNENRKQAYQCNVTYGTNSEFGFDYLRDNMKTDLAEQCQRTRDFAIVDEVDSILIDEARTPLIISGPAHDDSPKYKAADEVTRKLILAQKPWDNVNARVDAAKRKIKGAQGELKMSKSDAGKTAQLETLVKEGEQELAKAEELLANEVQLYEVEFDRKTVHLTHEGIQKAQEFAGVGSFYIGSNMDWPHLLEQSLRAHIVYERDKDYMVENDEVIIIDEFTGRKMVGRQWSDGLHQSVEAKERVKVKPETQTMATVTLQNFFKLYKRIGGMTGTAMTEAEEFMKIYKLDVVNIPTNRPVVRNDQEDLIYMSERAKWDAIVNLIKEISDRGQPVLVGTTSVEKSEKLSSMLMRRHGIEHEVLNAKQHEREADIVANAGRQRVNKLGETVGAVTIATNMAGRGTDIKLGSGVTEAGGLFVLGTERHEARRIDNQLRGRSGRQGDPGMSRFYLSLEDDLMKLFAGDFVLKALQRLGMQEDEPIEHSWVSNSVKRAQKKVEERNFGIRKQLLEYDEVRDIQRNYFYKLRQTILEGRNLQGMIFDLISEAVDDAVAQRLDSDYVPTVISGWVRENFRSFMDPSDLRDNDLHVLEISIKDHCRDDARTSITTSLDEFMDPDADAQDWDYNGLANWVKTEFGITPSAADLKALGRDEIRESLVKAALEKIDQIDCSALSAFLVKGYAQEQLAKWANDKFELQINAADLLGKGQEAAADMILQLASQSYQRREIEYPIEYALEVTLGAGGTENIYASEQLAQYISGKYGVVMTGSDVRALPLPKLHERLVEISTEANTQIDKQIDEAIEKLPESELLAGWVSKRFLMPVGKEEFDGEPLEEKRQRLHELGHAFLRKELTEMERAVLLQIFDTTWKDHLYAMDQLRESIGLRSFAEKDPRIEYKKEGTNLFRQFQRSIRDKVTEIIFRVRLSRSHNIRNVYANQQEVYQKQQSYGVSDSPAAQEARAQQQKPAANGQRPAEAEESKVAQIVNTAPKVGRNDPCPCGSGRKYKHCCGRNA